MPGTVEFLFDNRDGKYYFLEMNTRLQVEHAVTELVTGVDIVKEQIAIAAGRRMRYQQQDMAPKGWAIECRITAEDPFNGFVPSVGTIVYLQEPTGPGVRVESALYRGAEISTYYDPMVAKLVVWGETRAEAILRMRRALNEFRIGGIQTSIPFHQEIMDSTEFIWGTFDTGYLERRKMRRQLVRNVEQERIAAGRVRFDCPRGESPSNSHRRRQAAEPRRSAWRRSGRQRATRGRW